MLDRHCSQQQANGDLKENEGGNEVLTRKLGMDHKVHVEPAVQKCVHEADSGQNTKEPDGATTGRYQANEQGESVQRQPEEMHPSGTCFVHLRVRDEHQIPITA